MDSNFRDSDWAVNIISGSRYIRELWIAGVLSAMVAIWRHMNNVIFDEEEVSITKCKQHIGSMIIWTVTLSKAGDK